MVSALASRRHFVLLLFLVLGREFATAFPTVPLSTTTQVAVVIFSLLFALGLALACARGCTGREQPEQEFSRRRRRLETAWVIAHPITLLLSGAFDRIEVLGARSELFAAFVLLVPSLFFFLVIEYLSAYCDSQVTSQAMSTGHASEVDTSLWNSFRLRIKLGDFAAFLICSAPVLLISGICDLGMFAASVLRTNQSSSAVWFFDEYPMVLFGFASGVALLVCFALMPMCAGIWVQVQSLEGSSLGVRIRHFQERIGLRSLTPVLVPSSNRWAGAAVLGWIPYCRSLWLGDALVSSLARRELDMVLFHELAHVTRKHFWWRSLPIVWAIGINLSYFLFAGVLEADALPLWVGRSLSLLLSASVLVFGLGSVSRSCELDADQEACRMAREHCCWATKPGAAESALASALAKLSDERRSVRGWLHPSFRERLTSLAAGVASRRNQLPSVTV